MTRHKIGWTDHGIGDLPFRLLTRGKNIGMNIICDRNLPAWIKHLFLTGQLIDNGARCDHLLHRGP